MKILKRKNIKKRTRKTRKQSAGFKKIAINNTAVIIEPRKHKALSFVLRNVLENLDDTWHVKIHHGISNEEYIKTILENDLPEYRKRVSLENLGVENLSRSELNKLLLDINFLEKIPTENYIFFQTDSMINPNNRDLLEKFMNYDFVGAPFSKKEFQTTLDQYVKFANLNIRKIDVTKEGFVGNGGFSFRKKSKMIKILKDLSSDFIDKILKDQKYGEDLIFSLGTNNVKVNKPSFEKSKEFSIEQVYVPKVFAVHCPWKNLNEDELNDLKNDCPGLDKLINLQATE